MNLSPKFEDKFDPQDYEIGTMIYAEFVYTPKMQVWPYLLILGTDNGLTPTKKWRFIPMYSGDGIGVLNWDGMADGRGTAMQPTIQYGLPHQSTDTTFDTATRRTWDVNARHGQYNWSGYNR